MHILDHTKVDLFYFSFKMIHNLKKKRKQSLLDQMQSIRYSSNSSGHPLRCVCYYSCYVFKQVGWLFLLCKLCEILSVFSSSTTAAQLMQTPKPSPGLLSGCSFFLRYPAPMMLFYRISQMSSKFGQWQLVTKKNSLGDLSFK